MDMITLSSVTKTFGSYIAVNDVSFTVGQGEYLALLGPNGAGKTTIVRMLLGFSHPTKGVISICGRPAETAESRKTVGYLAENPRIPSGLSGREFLLRHAALIGLGRAETDKEIDRTLELVAMKGKEKKPASTYSRGMMQRFGLASAMLGNPNVLILDEPVSGLDPIGIRTIRRVLEQLKENNATLILNSHLLSEVEKTCDAVGIIHKGRMIAYGPIASIVKEGETLEDVFVRTIEVGGEHTD
jgi:ABC-2 type transport system ATP-binding protein